MKSWRRSQQVYCNSKHLPSKIFMWVSCYEMESMESVEAVWDWSKQAKTIGIRCAELSGKENILTMLLKMLR